LTRRILVICLGGAFLALGVPSALAHGGHGGHHGRFLFVGTDTEEFHGAPNGPDRLGRFQTRGPNVTGSTIITTNYPINGMTDAYGFLYSGDPNSNVIRRISYNGNLLGSTVAAFPATCCSEDMVLLGRFLYHVHYPSSIEKLNPTTGALVQTYAQPGVVGITLVNDDHENDDDDHGKSVVRLDWSGNPAWSHHHDREIWITKWIPQQVGIWDPATNTFTPRFTTPNRAGGLAWDSAKKVLWVGLRGGTVVPYRLDGTPYNAGFQPFGSIDDTIDGLEFVRKGHDHHHD
jgi:hypothetical protein